MLAGISPSSSLRIEKQTPSCDRNTLNAPRYDGASTSTASPWSSIDFDTSVIASTPPDVTIRSSAPGVTPCVRVTCPRSTSRSDAMP